MDRLVQLAYVSRQNRLSETDVDLLVEASQRNNKRLGVGGFLVLVQDVFFQVLEGPMARVEKLFLTIQADERHYDVAVVSHQPVTRRQFQAWGMVRLPTCDVGFRRVADCGTCTPGEDPCTLHESAHTRCADLIAAGALIHDMAARKGDEVAAMRNSVAWPTA